MKKLSLFAFPLLFACSHTNYNKTVAQVDRDRFMRPWYVQAGRFTIVEKDPYNSVESYTWNEKEKRIDIDFHYNQGSLTGERKSYPQKGWIADSTNARWKVQPFWPLKFDYLVIGLDPNYEWTAIGVPNQKYLWIMTSTPQFPKARVQQILNDLKQQGYSTEDIQYVEHSPK
jgi:apolipoprotein D and lipocalin family protein